MLRTLCAVALMLLACGSAADAARRPVGAIDTFSGDRYVARVAQTPNAREVVREVQKRRHHPKVRYYRKKRTAPPVIVERRETVQRRAVEQPVAPQTVWGGITREVTKAVSTVIGGRPDGCPRQFCGCGASLHVFGKIIPALNLAANWLRFPRAEPAPGMVAARPGHVFVLKQHIAGGVWLVHDSNSGRHLTRIHPRSIAGFKIVNPHGGSG